MSPPLAASWSNSKPTTAQPTILPSLKNGSSKQPYKQFVIFSIRCSVKKEIFMIERDHRKRYPYRENSNWVLVDLPEVKAVRRPDGTYRLSTTFMGAEYNPTPSSLELHFLDQLWNQLYLDLQHHTP